MTKKQEIIRVYNEWKMQQLEEEGESIEPDFEW